MKVNNMFNWLCLLVLFYFLTELFKELVSIFDYSISSADYFKCIYGQLILVSNV